MTDTIALSFGDPGMAGVMQPQFWGLGVMCPFLFVPHSGDPEKAGAVQPF